MKKNLVKSLLIATAFLCSSTTFASAVDPNVEYRVALVIGNSAYETSELKNPVNDANDIATALQDLGFEVVLGTNLNRDQINEKVREFSPMLEKADIGFFYFAGHGFQYAGENYLVPISFNINDEKDIPRETLSTGRILKKMDLAGNAVNIVVLDACRNNPYADSYETEDKRSLSLASGKSDTRGLIRSGSSGLAQIDGPSGSFIAYATAPGNVAADGSGRNGLYTQHLLDYIDQPGMPIEQVFKKVRVGVMKDTAGNQVPWENSSLLGDFYFADLGEPVSKSLDVDFMPVDKKQDDKKKQEADNFELQFWSSVEKANTLELYNAYLNKYPQGHFVEIAKIQAKQLKQQELKASIEKQIQEQRKAKMQGQNSHQAIAKTSVDNSLKVESPTDKTAAIGDTFAMTKVEKQAGQSKPLKVSNYLPDPFNDSDFVKITSGCFTMGSAFGEEGRQNDELDHKVCLTKDFMMGKYEVTQAQWKAVMGKNPAYFSACGSDCPVERVSWNDVQTFLFRLNLMTGKNYRLPTEAEWEYAARANTSTSTYAGNIELEGTNNAPGLDKIAWYSGNTKVNYKGGKYCEDWDDKQFPSVRCGTQKVGQKQPNAWGLYDMIGNVWELTDDWYGSFSSRIKNDPKGAKSGDLKVAKGGNWADSLQQNRAAARYGFSVTERSNNLGFRLVRQ